jgi:hypothetical protein
MPQNAPRTFSLRSEVLCQTIVMTESPTAHIQPQPHVHFFSNGLLTNTLPVHDEWATIEEDLAHVNWEEVLKRW